MSEQGSEILVEAVADQPEVNIQDDGIVSADVVNLSQASASTVKAEIVRISQGGAEQVIASEVEIKQGGANRIQAEDVKFSDGVAAFVQAGSVDLKDSGIGIVRAQNIFLNDSGVGIAYSETVEMEEGSAVGAIVAREVTSETIKTKVLLSGNVTGNVETVMDTNQALFAGMAAGAIIGLFLFIGQLFSRRN